MKEKVAAESKMENAVRQMEIVVKAMTRKVLYLEEEIGNVKENSNKIERKGNNPLNMLMNMKILPL